MNEAIASSEYTKVEIEKLARGADPAVLAPNKKVKAGPEALFADAQSKLERAEAAQALPAHLHSEFADIAQLRASRDALQSRCIPDGDVEGQLQATLQQVAHEQQGSYNRVCAAGACVNGPGAAPRSETPSSGPRLVPLFPCSLEARHFSTMLVNNAEPKLPFN